MGWLDICCGKKEEQYRVGAFETPPQSNTASPTQTTPVRSNRSLSHQDKLIIKSLIFDTAKLCRQSDNNMLRENVGGFLQQIQYMFRLQKNNINYPNKTDIETLNRILKNNDINVPRLQVTMNNMIKSLKADNDTRNHLNTYIVQIA